MITLTSCISVDYDLPFLPHFINHYSKLEIDTYLLIFHSKNEFNFSEIHKTLKPIVRLLYNNVYSLFLIPSSIMNIPNWITFSRLLGVPIIH